MTNPKTSAKTVQIVASAATMTEDMAEDDGIGYGFAMVCNEWCLGDLMGPSHDYDWFIIWAVGRGRVGRHATRVKISLEK